MSEKHLTEAPWKQLATKQKIKDPGLGKALAAYGKAGEQDYDARLAALDEIKSEAGGLQKEKKNDKEVSGYLAEVLKEVDKTRKVIGDLQKSGGGGEDDAEAEEYKKDLKKKLVSALTQVKGRAPGATEPGEEGKAQLQFMAYVASGASAVIVAKKVGGATKKLLPEIAGGASGGKYISGECIFEKNVHTFVVEKVPGGLAKKLSKALLAETGIKYKVRVRSLDGAQELDSDTDTDADEIPEAPPLPGIDPKQLLDTLNKLTPLIKKAVEANPGRKEEILRPVATFQAQLKANQFLEAKATLLQIGDVLKRLKATPGGGSTNGISVVKLGKARLEWDGVRTQALQEIQRLKGILQKAYKGDDDAQAALSKADERLNSIIASFNEELGDRLDEVLNAEPAERPKLATVAKSVLERFRSSVESDKLMSVIDGNEFAPEMKVAGPLRDKLQEIAAALG